MLDRILALGFLGSVLLTAQTVSQVPFSEFKSSVTAFSSSGHVVLPAASFQVTVQDSRSRINRGNVAIIYDPQTGFYFWRFNPVDSASDLRTALDSYAAGLDAMYISPAGMVEFSFPGDLLSVTRTKRAESLTLAEAGAIGEILGTLSSSDPYSPGYQVVDVANQIGARWACPQADEEVYYSNCPFRPKEFVSINNVDNQWRIVVRNRWDQQIVLDSDFKFVSTNRVPSGSN